MKISLLTLACTMSFANTPVYANSCDSDLTVEFSDDGTSVIASSNKKLSNVVLFTEDGTEIKFDNLKSYEDEFFADDKIVEVCIKSGCEKGISESLIGKHNSGYGECILAPSCPANAISITDASELEGTPFKYESTLEFSVNLTEAVTSDKCEITVDFSTVDSLVAPLASADDYVSDSGVITFTKGESTKNISIAIIADSDTELTEFMNIQLSNVLVGGEVNEETVLSNSSAVGKIINDDIEF